MVQTTQEINLMSTTSQRSLIYLSDSLACSHLIGSSRENHALTLLDRHLEITCGEQILIAIVTTLNLLGVLEIVVPIGSSDKLGISLVCLQIEPRITLIKFALHTARYRI